MTRRSPPRARAVAAATVAVFLAVFALLVFQLRSGRDPALGQGTTLAKAPVPPPKRILVRKTIVTRVIVHLPAERRTTRRSAWRRRRGARRDIQRARGRCPGARACPPAPAPAPLTTRSS